LSTAGDQLRARAAQQRLDAGQQLGHREGLDHIVVGAGREAAHALFFLAARGDHDDRRARGFLAGAPAAAELDAGQAGQHPVEQDQVGHAVADALHRLVAALGGDNAEAFGLEVVAQHQGEIGLVLDDQDGGAS
jgi:hypothetical protein